MPTPQTTAPPFVVHDSRFEDVVGEAPTLDELVAADAHEGPVYVAAEHALYFTTVRRPGEPVAIERLDLATAEVSLVRADANNANGMALDADGSLLVCEQGSLDQPARIARTDPATGATESVVDSWRGFPFNSPNDVVVSADGAIWFTDPSYGHLQGFRFEPRLADAVYRHDPATGRTDAVAAGFDKPNGLAFSPDGSLLYVADNGAPHHLLAFPVDGVRLGRPVRLAAGTPGHPDGLKVDAAGRLYASATTGIRIHAPGGDLIGELRIPGTVNFCFGGPARNVLYVTTDTAVWAAVLNAKGA